MYFACLAIIESLSPVQAHWTRAAFTVVMSHLRRGMDKDGADPPSAPSRSLGARRSRARHAWHGLPGLLLDVALPEERHEDVVGHERGPEAPEPRAGLEPVKPRSLVVVDLDEPADDVEPADEGRDDPDQERDDRVGVHAPRVAIAVDAVFPV